MLDTPYLIMISGVGLIIAGLSGAVYFEHLKIAAADAKTTVAERDRDQWKNNFIEADRVAKANAASIDDMKKRLAASSKSADDAKADAAADEAKYALLLTKVKEQHAPTDSSPFMRAYLDGLCQAATTATCRNY